MKKPLLLSGIVLLSLATLFSCQNDTEITEEIGTTEALSIEKNFNDVPGLDTLESINDLRNAGVAVSNSLARRVNNSLPALLNAADLSTSRRGRRTLRNQRFRRFQIRELQRIAAQIENLVIVVDDPVDPDPAPAPDPVEPGVILQIADLNLSADAELALSFRGAATGSVRNAIDRTVTSVSTNAVGLFSLADDGRVINQNGQLRTRDQFEQQILDGFRRRFTRTARNSVRDFDAVVEEFRPLAANATNNLFFLLNNQ